MKNVLVIGAGISGLSTGLLLLRHGYAVTIWAKDFPPNTTSDKAGAFWYPYLCEPKDKAAGWAKVTYDYLQAEMLPYPETGCIARRTTEILAADGGAPWWHDAYPSYKRPSKDVLPRGYTDGYMIDGILMDSSVYLPYLVKLFRQKGGILRRVTIAQLGEPLEYCRVVVNCTGLGARELCNDDQLYPIRGQMIRMRSNAFTQIVADDTGPNSLGLIVPRLHDILLGGTVQPNDWNTAVDPDDTATILKRCAAISPLFKHVDIIDQIVGLRPGRDAVRLEAEELPDKTIIHNYGHGGSGYTLSWGCAADVLELVKQHFVRVAA
jgi:D-amino-acid oxidase